MKKLIYLEPRVFLLLKCLQLLETTDRFYSKSFSFPGTVTWIQHQVCPLVSDKLSRQQSPGEREEETRREANPRPVSEKYFSQG